MRLLLDTHFVLWWVSGSAKLRASARSVIQNSDCAVSTVSLMEMRLKVAAGKLAAPSVGAVHRALQADGFASVPVLPEHVHESERFEASHPDFHDRLLLATAVCEKRTLLTRDAALLELARSARLDFVLEG